MACAMPRQVRRFADCGWSRHACCRRWMYSDSSCDGTVCGSRQGIEGSDGCGDRSTAAVVVTSASEMGCMGLVPHDRFGLEHELRIAKGAHLRDVQACELGLRRDALSDDGIDDQVYNEAE